MQREEAGAATLQRKLADWGYASQRDGDVLHLDHWDLKIRMQLMEEGKPPGGVSQAYHAYTYHEWFERPVFDVALGWGATADEAQDTAAETYLSSVFPVVHAVFCEQGEHFGVHRESLYGMDEATGLAVDWQLLIGPQVLLNLTREQIPQGTLHGLIEDLLQPLLARPGTHWLKCFVARLGRDEVQADCFLNNVELAEGKQRFLAHAATLPGPPDGLASCKQHLLLVPLDFAERIGRSRQARWDRWGEVLERRAAGLDAEAARCVLQGFDSFVACDGLDEDVVREHLVDHGIAPEQAWRVVSFLPTACARDFWGPRGVGFADEYILLNFATGKGDTRQLSAEPIFQAAVEIIRAFRAEDVSADAMRVANEFSADTGCICKAMADGAKPSDVKMTALLVPTREPVEGQVDPHLLRELGIGPPGPPARSAAPPRPQKPWWKLW